jgi:LacI family transcriptional regulator
MTNIQDVAKAAGVSTASVTRYLAGQTIRRADAVKQAIDELGYRPSHVARSLKTGRHDSIGVIVPDISNPFFAALVKGVEREMRPHGMQVILGNSDEDAGREEALVRELSQRTDGIIMAPLTENDEIPLALMKTGIALVFVDRDIASGPDVDRVLVDNASGVRQAVDHLVGLGHTRIAAISGPLDSTPGRMRHEALLSSFAHHGIAADDSLLRIGDFREASGRAAIQEIWAAPERPTAVFVANNLMTTGALTALMEMGVRVPSDLSVVGFDDLPLAALLDPPLTVISRPDVDQGAAAARLLVERLGEAGRPSSAPHPTQSLVLPVELVVRGSTIAVPAVPEGSPA